MLLSSHNYILILILLLFLLFPKFVEGKEYRYTYSISLNQSYDDNIYLSRNKISDYILDIKPKLIFQSTTERSNINTNISLNMLKYFHYTKLGTIEKFCNIKLKYLQSLRLSYYLISSYIQDTTLQSEWKETGIALTREKRENYKINPTIKYLCNKKDMIIISPSYIKTDYQSKYYTNYIFDSFTADYLHNLDDQRSTINLNSKFTYFKSKICKADDYSFNISYKYMISQLSNVKLTFGLDYLISYYKYGYVQVYPYNNLQLLTKKTKKLGMLVDIEYYRKFITSLVCVGMQRNIVPSATGIIFIRNRVFFNIIKNLTTRNKINFKISGYSSNYKLANTTIKYYSYNMVLNYSYLLSKKLMIFFRYIRQYYKNEISNFSTVRNVFLLGIKWHISYI